MVNKKFEKKTERGFTLMETLLAITLFAIVITSSFGVFSMGIQIWKRTTGSLRYEKKIFMALEKMQTDIQAALPVPKVDELVLKVKRDMEFEANDKSFLFPAVILVEDEKGGVTYQYGAQGYAFRSDERILCRQTLTAGDFLLRKEPGCRTVLQNVLHANFEYLVPNSVKKSHSWYPEWKGKDGIPRAVRITFEIAPKDPKKDRPQIFVKTFWIPVSETRMKDFVPGAE